VPLAHGLRIQSVCINIAFLLVLAPLTSVQGLGSLR
jgi:hypothetical protein